LGDRVRHSENVNKGKGFNESGRIRLTHVPSGIDKIYLITTWISARQGGLH